MSLSDYEHWNEDAKSMWWQEEGRHPLDSEPDEYYDEYDADREIDFPWDDEEDDL